MIRRITIVILAIVAGVMSSLAQRAVIVDGILYRLMNMDDEANAYAIIYSSQLPKDSITTLEFRQSVELDGVSFPVTHVGADVFADCKSLSELTIPPHIKHIDENAFKGCTSLMSITIENGDSSLYISSTAFTGVPVPKLYIGRNLTSFRVSGSELESVTFAPDITTLPYRAFANCKKLTSIVLPPKLEIIGGDCFANCTNLVNLVIPESVEEIRDGAFLYCKSWEPNIPHRVKYIGIEAFANTNFETISLPETLTYLGGSAFESCDALKEITFPSSLVHIPERVLKDCTNLHTVRYSGPEKILDIGSFAFWGCKSLKGFKLPPNIDGLNEGVLGECFLDSISIPPAARYIQVSALYNAASHVIIEDGDKTIGLYVNWAFYRENEREPWSCGDTFKTLYLGRNIYFNSNRVFKGLNSISSITFGPKVTEFVPGFLAGAGGLKKIIVPKQITTLPEWAFMDSSLEEVVIEGVETIRAEAFANCKNLTTITFSDALKEYSPSAFSNTNIKNIIFNAVTPPLYPDDFFKDFYDVVTLYVPDESLHLYKTTFPWVFFKDIRGMSAGVKDATADQSGLPVEYYDLSGRRITDTNLSHGIYLRRQGSVTKKIIL